MITFTSLIIDKIIYNHSIKTSSAKQMDVMPPKKTLRTTQHAAFNVKSKRFSLQVGTHLNKNSDISMLDVSTVTE